MCKEKNKAKQDAEEQAKEVWDSWIEEVENQPLLDHEETE